MDCRNIVLFFSQTKHYPVKLAQKIGLERTVYFYELFLRYGDTEFKFVEEIPILLGITKARDVFDSLYSLGYLVKNENGSYGLCFDKMFEITEGASLNAAVKPPFTDSNFIRLLNDHMRILKEKGRKVNTRELYKKFDGVSLEKAIRGLQYAVTNQHVTLFLDDNSKGSSKSSYGGNKGGRGYTSGGGTQSPSTGSWTETEI